MADKVAKKSTLLVGAGVVLALLFGSVIYQTSQHEAYIQRAVKEFNARTSMSLVLLEFDSGLFSSTAITGLVLPTEDADTLQLRHHFKSSPFFKITVKSTLNLTDPQTASLGDSTLVGKLKNMQIMTEVSSKSTEITAGFASFPLDDANNFSADGVEVKVIIVPVQTDGENAAQYKVDSTVTVDRISGMEEGVKVAFNGAVFHSSSILADEIMHNSTLALELERISIVDDTSRHFLRISGVTFKQDIMVSDLTDAQFVFGIQKAEIVNSAIEDVEIRISLKNLDTRSLNQFFAFLMEETAQQDLVGFGRFLTASVGIFSKTPTLVVDSIKATVNDATAQMHGQVSVKNIAEFFPYGITAQTLRNIDLKVNISADKNIYTALAKFALAISNMEQQGTDTATDTEIQQHAAMLRSAVARNQFFKETAAGISAEVTVVNGAGFVNGQRVM